MFNPGFPWYLSVTRIVGATPVLLELTGPDFAPDMDKVSSLSAVILSFCCDPSEQAQKSFGGGGGLVDTNANDCWDLERRLNGFEMLL